MRGRALTVRGASRLGGGAKQAQQADATPVGAAPGPSCLLPPAPGEAKVGGHSTPMAEVPWVQQAPERRHGLKGGESTRRRGRAPKARATTATWAPRVRRD